MPSNSVLFQRIQLGKQSVFGTPVAASRRMAALMGSYSPQVEVSTYRPAGSRLTSVAALNKEWSQISLEESPITYNEIVYLLDSLLGTATPTGNGTSTPYVRTYDVTRDPAGVRQMYTVEHGSSDRGRDIPDAVVSSLQLTFNRSGATLSGEMIGNAMVDNQALTGSLSELDIVPVLAPQVGLKFAATQAGLAAASLTTDDFIVTMNFSNISAPVWALNQQTGFAGHVETLPEIGGRVTRQVDAAGMTLLANLRAGSTHFMRLSATGPVLAGIAPAAYNALQIDVAMKISGFTFEDHEGVYVVGWDYTATFDPTWVKGVSLTVTNGLAST